MSQLRYNKDYLDIITFKNFMKAYQNNTITTENLLVLKKLIKDLKSRGLLVGDYPNFMISSDLRRYHVSDFQ